MDQLTPTQWELLRVAWQVAERARGGEFVVRDVALAAGEISGQRSYRAVQALMTQLAERGYLGHEPGRGGPAPSLFWIAREPAVVAREYIEGLVEQLGDEPELLVVAQEVLEEHLAAHRPVATGTTG